MATPEVLKNMAALTSILSFLKPQELISIIVSDLALYRKLQEFRQLSKQILEGNPQ